MNVLPACCFVLSPRIAKRSGKRGPWSRPADGDGSLRFRVGRPEELACVGAVRRGNEFVERGRTSYGRNVGGSGVTLELSHLQDNPTFRLTGKLHGELLLAI